MARDPFPHQADHHTLESTTAITSVSAASMKDVGRQAAKLADDVAHAGEAPRPSGRKASRKGGRSVAVTEPPPSVEVASKPAWDATEPVRDAVVEAAAQGVEMIEAATDAFEETGEMTRHVMIEAVAVNGSVARQSTDTVEEIAETMQHTVKQAAELGGDTVEIMAESDQEMIASAQQGAAGVAEQSAEATDAVADVFTEAADTSLQTMTDVVEAVAAPAAEGVGGVALAKAMSETTGLRHSTVTTLAQFNATLAEAMRVNIEATMCFWTSMLDARSVSQAAALNTDHLQRQMDAFAAQSRALASLTQRLALDAWRGFAVQSADRQA